jgi:hypothetical protein
MRTCYRLVQPLVMPDNNLYAGQVSHTPVGQCERE